MKNLPLLVDKLRLRHGKLVYLDRDRHPVAQLEDINVDGATTDPQHAHGALWFARAGGEHGGAALTNYWTAVDFDTEKGLAVRDGHGDLAGGVLNTDFRLEPREDRLVYSTSAVLQNAAIGQLSRPAADQPPVAEGQLHGRLDLRGFTDDPVSRAGGGRLWVEGGKMHNLPLLNLAGQVLKIADLSHLDFKQAQVDYKVEGTTFRIDPLTLVTNDARIVIRGNYLTAEDRLDLHGRLMIDQAVSHQLPQFIESNFTPCGSEAPGSRYLDFDITGPAKTRNATSTSVSWPVQ